VLFLHLVPMMARWPWPLISSRTSGMPEFSMLDFALLLTWWLFLYVYAVIPWQYVHVNEAIYSNNFNQVYSDGKTRSPGRSDPSRAGGGGRLAPSLRATARSERPLRFQFVRCQLGHWSSDLLQRKHL